MAEQDVNKNKINGIPDETMNGNEPRRSSRSNKSKINYKLLVSKPRSKSCSQLTPQKQIIEEDMDIDNGNELVQMMKSKFTLKSPMLKLTTIPSAELEI